MNDANHGLLLKEPADSITAERVQAEQIRSVVRHTPIMMLANFCNALVFLADVWNTRLFPLALYWTAAVLCVAGYIYFRLLRRRRDRRILELKSSRIRNMVTNAVALGACWAALPLFFFQEASPGAQLLIACLCAGMLGGGAFALAGVPAAAAAFLGPIALASSWALIQSGDVDHSLVAVVLCIYTFVLLKGVVGYAEQVRTRVLTQIEAEQNARLRMQNLQAGGLNAMGGLATGLAHEINQPLSACGAYLATARRLLKMPVDMQSSSVDDVLNSAAEQNMRAGEIVNHLRAFIMRGEPDKIFLGLHQIIGEACYIAVSGIDTVDFDLNLQLDAPNDSILADRVQIKQVLVNLIRNAIEAMKFSSDRKLTVSTHLIEDSIRTDVIDTGCGFPSELTPDLFQPFNTTKPGGMGIGLALSRSIVEAHHGIIWAESIPGAGTVFSFLLPLANAETEA
jgi:C4-dicarboxylate-specific signal transduction histidine kinase